MSPRGRGLELPSASASLNSNVQKRAHYSASNFQQQAHILEPAIPTAYPGLVVRDNPHAPYLKNKANMHPFLLVPLLASFTALYPVGAMPMEFATPVALPGVGAATLGLILPTNVPNPDLPKLPFRRGLDDVKMSPNPQPVVGFGHDPPVPEPTRMVKRRSLLDTPKAAPERARQPPKIQEASTAGASGSGLFSGLPAGGPASAVPSEAGSSGQESSPLGSVSSGSVLSSLPVSQAGSTAGSAPGYTSDIPETPPTPATPASAEEDVQQEPAAIEDSKAEKDVVKEDPVTTQEQKSAVGGSGGSGGTTFNPTHPSHRHPNSKIHKGPPPVQRRAMTTYYHTVNSRSVLTNKAHSFVLDTDPVVPPQDPDSEYDPRMGVVNVDSDSKSKPFTEADTAKTQAEQVAAAAPKNATLPAH